MRISIDTNVFISYLLQPYSDGAHVRIVHATFTGQVDLLLSESHLEELQSTVRRKPYLQRRIPEDDLDTFIARVRLVATVTPPIDAAIPSITRDSADDYLIVHAIIEQAHYLVSGDHDLLELSEFEGVRIVSPAVFAALLDHSEE